MQSLWTRARTATNSCRCHLCSSSSSSSSSSSRVAVQRRAATGPTRRRHGGGNEAITLLYGTVMAAALWTDAASKIGRRAQLDGELQRTKAESEALQRANEERLKVLGAERLAGGAVGTIAANLTVEEELYAEHDVDEQIRFDAKEYRGKAGTDVHMARVWRDHVRQLLQGGDMSEREKVRVYISRLRRRLDGEAQAGDSDANGGKREWQQPSARDRAYVVRKVAKPRSVRMRRLREAKMELRDETSPALMQKWQDAALRHAQKSGWRQHESHARESRQELDLAALLDAQVKPWPVGRDPEQLWQTPYTERRSRYWLTRQEYAMSTLICRLAQRGLKHSKEFKADLGLDEANVLHPTQLDMQSLDAEIEKQKALYEQAASLIRHRPLAYHLERAAFPQYETHVWGEDQSYQDRVRTMNNRLGDAFAASKESWSTLANVCNILATSVVPPNVHTFNILLTNMHRVGLSGLSDEIWATMGLCGVSVNEVTMIAYLRSLGSRSKASWFDYWIGRMGVKNGNGLLSLEPSTFQLAEETPDVLSDSCRRRKSYAQTSNLPTCRSRTMALDQNPDSNRESKRFLRMPFNKELYEVIIVGYVRQGKMEKALQMLARMKASGFMMTAKILNALVLPQIASLDMALLTRLHEDVVAKNVEGSKEELIEAAFLLAQVWSLSCAHGWYSADAKRTDRAFARNKVDSINAWASRNSLLEEDLDVRNFETLTKRQRQLLSRRLDLIRVLEQPVLHLQFNDQEVRNLTRARPASLWTDKQPVNLDQLVCERLAILHQDQEKHHGVYPESLGLGHSAVLQCAWKRGELEAAKSRSRQFRREETAEPSAEAAISTETEVPVPSVDESVDGNPLEDLWQVQDTIPAAQQEKVIPYTLDSCDSDLFAEIRGSKWTADLPLIPGRVRWRASIEAR